MVTLTRRPAGGNAGFAPVNQSSTALFLPYKGRSRAAPGEASLQRIDWLDLAKAICILLVVLTHVRSYSDTLPWDAQLALKEGWDLAVAQTRPFRMPIFFLVSGILSARLLERPWAEGGRQRAARLYYVYAVWAAITPFALSLAVGRGFPNPLILVPAILAGASEAWYLWALPTYLFIAWITRRAPWWVAIGLALLVALAAPYAPDRTYRSILRCLPYFLIGARLAGPVLALAASATLARTAAAAALYAGILALQALTALVPQPAVDCAAIMLGVNGVALAARHGPWLLPFGRWLGARTLPIYVLHFPLVAALSLAVARLAPPRLIDSAGFASLYVPAMTATVVAAALIFHGLMMRSGARLLFEPPEWRFRNRRETALQPS